MFCIFSWILSSCTSVLIIDRFIYQAERVAVILTIAREAVKVVVESLPGVFHIIIAEVLEVTVVQLACLVEEPVKTLEVKSNASSEFTAVQQNKELGLDTCIKVLLD